MAIGEARIASPERVTSQGEATVLVLPLEVNLALLCRAFSSSEDKIASLLASGGTLSLAHSRVLSTWCFVTSFAAEITSIKCCYERDAESATRLVPKSVLALASRDRRG